MNYTTNYHLPQWDETDRIMRTDFNRMCADMENGLNSVKQGAASANAKTAQDAAAAANAAQSTADKAVADSAKAQAKADAAYSPDQPPYVVGSYTGTDLTQTVTVGFRPRVLIIIGQDDGLYTSFGFCALVGTATSGRHVQLTNTGFIVKRNPAPNSGSGIEPEPHLIRQGVTYNYIAFR